MNIPKPILPKIPKKNQNFEPILPLEIPNLEIGVDLAKDEDQQVYSITQTIVSQVVKEQDEYTMQQIENYVKEKQAKGEIISSRVLGEGKIRHIFNLGLMEYSRRNQIPITQEDLFTQEDYIQYLNMRLDEAEAKIRELLLENQKGEENE